MEAENQTNYKNTCSDYTTFSVVSSRCFNVREGMKKFMIKNKEAFDELKTNRENYDKLFIEIFSVLTNKYQLTTEQWNEDIAPIFRKYWHK